MAAFVGLSIRPTSGPLIATCSANGIPAAESWHGWMTQLGFAPLTETITAAIEAVRKLGDDF